MLLFIKLFIFLFLSVFLIFNIFLWTHSWNIYNCGVLLFYNFSELVLFKSSFRSKINCIWINFFFKNVSFLRLYFLKTFSWSCFFVRKFKINIVYSFLNLRRTIFLFRFRIVFCWLLLILKVNFSLICTFS